MNSFSNCRKCGKRFKDSPNGYTVNCPDCRGRGAAAKSAAPVGPPICHCGKTVLRPGVSCPRDCSCDICGSKVAHVHARPVRKVI